MAKRKLISIVLSLAIVALMIQPLFSIATLADAPSVWDGSIAQAYAGGDGTQANPYLISNGSELARLSSVTETAAASEGKYYRLTADIILNDTSADNWTESARGWYATTNQWLEYAFMGNFDGNGHVISGLYINNSDNDKSGGLFPAIRGNVTIENLGIVNSSITLSGSNTNAGAFAGITDGSFTLSKCFASSTVSVSAGSNAGGLIGQICGNGQTFDVENVYSNASLIAPSAFGIVAYQWPMYTGTISNAYTIGYDVFANSHGGTITNENEYSNVKTENYFAHDNLESTANMIGQSAKDNMDFDWDNVWNTKGSKYPYLRIFDEKYADGLYTGIPGAVWDGRIAECYDDGDGTSANPYLIATAAELARLVKTDLANTAGKYYKLTNDIILNDNNTNNGWLSTSPWLEYAFMGNFDGNGHVVSGLKINDSSTDGRMGGLFPSIKGNVTIRNLGIVNSTVVFTEVGTYAGALAGGADGNFTIDKCFVDSSVFVSAKEHVAGFIGKVDSGSEKTLSISNCYSLAWLDGTTNTLNRFGMFGYMCGNYTGSVTNVYTIGHDIFSNNGSWVNVTATNAYSDVNEHGYLHSCLWHKDYMVGDNAKNTYMISFDYGTVWNIKDNTYPYLRIFGDTYARGLNIGNDGVWDGTKAEAYFGGTGRYDNPYLISNANQLAKLVDDDINNSTDVYYKLTKDIILNDTSSDNWTDNARQWYSSSTDIEYHFEGVLDGDGHTVSGLYINDTTSTNRVGGLLRALGANATIKNLGIVNSSITFTGATTYAGALAGASNGNFNISRCFVGEDVSISATEHVGGFIGKVDSNESGKTLNIENAYSVATLSGGSLNENTGKNNLYGLFGFLWRNYTGNVKNVYTITHDLFPNDVGTVIKTVNEYSSGRDASWYTQTVLWHDEYLKGFEAQKYLNFDWSIWGFKPGKFAYLRIFDKSVSLYGDLNMDDSVNIIDLVLLKKHAATGTMGVDTTNDLIRKTSSPANALTVLINYLLTDVWSNENHNPENQAITGYSYVWGDEFNGTGLDGNIWSLTNPNYSDKYGDAICNESSDYLSVKDGKLSLKTTRTHVDDQYITNNAPWVNSNAGMNFKYGYLEMKAKVPFEAGAFPSLWLGFISGAGVGSYESLIQGTETEYAGEVDIFEYFGKGDRTISTNMYKWYTGADSVENSYKGTKKLTTEQTAQEHIFGFEWTETYMKMYIDGELYANYNITNTGNFDHENHTTDMDSFHDPAYIRLGNLFREVNNSGHTDANTEYSIDWIRLYQKNDGNSEFAVKKTLN